MQNKPGFVDVLLVCFRCLLENKPRPKESTQVCVSNLTLTLDVKLNLFFTPVVQFVEPLSPG